MSLENAKNEISKVTFALENITLEDLVSRHKKERKELQAKIQNIKKTAPKSDKKKRKDAMEEISQLEKDLETRQAAELKLLEKEAEPSVGSSGKDNVDDNEKPATAAADGDAAVSNEEPAPQQRISKAQKRRDKKEREAKQREVDILAAAEEAVNAPKALELRTIISKLKERSLGLQQVPSDGDCLYNAIRHQLIQHGLGMYTVKELRNETANYILANKDSLIFYMTNPKTGDSLSDEEFLRYCEAVRSTPAWGGQIELKALSSVLKVPIEVLQAEGAPTIQGEEEFAGPNLVVTYHRHMYSLGEHYNSTIPLEDVEENDENND